MKKINLHASDETFTVQKIFCIGKNYAEHAKEMQSDIPEFPVVFLKPTTALITNGEQICIPTISKQPHHEVELVVAIGKEGKNISESEAENYIFGYAVGLDMTLRDVQSEAKKKGLPWTIAKGFDTSAPVSSIVPKSFFSIPNPIEFFCTINGIEKQRGKSNEMIFSPTKLISFISKFFTLEVGDLIFTGTPSGVSEVHHGDIIEATLVGFTSIRHQVVFL
ncbi:MAG: fumarylacetoacetate hydrolase family protein [Ignavibacteriales bacterium]|nr:fumarylacetoacetate hydrolase family protein [Ignavibacteriales bacterium]